jgi:stage IV sporulation protein FB
MLRFRFLGFPIVVHWFFWVNMALLGGAITASTPEAMRALLMWMLAGFLSILIHELGHALAMRRYGDRHVGILLYAFGGVAQGSRGLTRRQDFIVSAAGPFVQIAAGLLLLFLFDVWKTSPSMVRILFSSFIQVSLFWGILNLFPIIPLDGGHIARALLGPRRLHVALGLSLVCAIGGAIYFLLNGSLFATVFFGMFAFNNWKELQGQPQVPWMIGRD